MDNYIGRQAAIDVLAIGEELLNRVLDEMDVVGYERKKYEWGLDLIKSYISDMKELPSAQPEHTETHSCENKRTATHEWILCSERLPEEHEWMGTKKFGTTISDEVYVTFETPDGERFAKHISFQNGKLSSVDEQRMKVWYKGAKPIAWMPLPKPYAERKE